VRLSRRVFQDTIIRKIPLDDSIKNYLENIKPAFEQFTEPTKKFADMVIPHFGGGYSNNYDDICKILG
jgi:uridine kinase